MKPSTSSVDADELQDVPAGDLGVGGPAEDTGDGQGAQTPPGYPEEVDPTQGPIAARRGGQLGDLKNPGAGQGD
jgi:hypothetical protein